MFIRSKRIHGKRYAYLVENTWTPQGSRQRTKGYLGRIVELGEVSFDFSGVSSDNPGRQLAQLLLTHLGFSFDGFVATRDTLRVDLDEHDVSEHGKPVTLRVNEGFVCSYTLQRLEDLKSCNKEHFSRELAKRLLQAGIPMEEKSFIELYEKLVPN